MNREQAENMLPIIQALAEGKHIQYKDILGNWGDIDSIDVKFYNPDRYRIKPELKYRPFKDARECWHEIQKHGPIGWVKALHGYFHITGITNANVNCGVNDNWLDYEYMMEHYKFIDDAPFGIEENA